MFLKAHTIHMTRATSDFKNFSEVKKKEMRKKKKALTNTKYFNASNKKV